MKIKLSILVTLPAIMILSSCGKSSFSSLTGSSAPTSKSGSADSSNTKTDTRFADANAGDGESDGLNPDGSPKSTNSQSGTSSSSGTNTSSNVDTQGNVVWPPVASNSGSGAACSGKDCPPGGSGTTYVKPADVTSNAGGICTITSLQATTMDVLCQSDANAGLNRPVGHQSVERFYLEAGKFIPPMARIDSVIFQNIEGDDQAAVVFNDRLVIDCTTGPRIGDSLCSPNSNVTSMVKSQNAGLKIDLNVRNLYAPNMWGKISFQINFH